MVYLFIFFLFSRTCGMIDINLMGITAIRCLFWYECYWINIDTRFSLQYISIIHCIRTGSECDESNVNNTQFSEIKNEIVGAEWSRINNERKCDAVDKKDKPQILNLSFFVFKFVNGIREWQNELLIVESLVVILLFHIFPFPWFQACIMEC